MLIFAVEIIGAVLAALCFTGAAVLFFVAGLFWLPRFARRRKSRRPAAPVQAADGSRLYSVVAA
jgi:hypothetical protein